MATQRKDIARDENNDIKIENGDFVIEASDQQHVQDIFKAHKGEYKQWPLVGFGASRYLKKTTLSKAEFLRDLKVQLKYDGYDNPNINGTIEQLTIEI
ncbi:oxidase [Aquimarina algiphila]|uniref:oxidase n=1 Tax=Aquimarina algiphila TaxID=2047982 RepID=UPI002330FEA8|nr:oxidase [Aquimarina algiphila]